MTPNLRDVIMAMPVDESALADMPGIKPIDPVLASIIAMVQQNIHTAGMALDAAQRGLATVLQQLDAERAHPSSPSATCPECGSTEHATVLDTNVCADCNCNWPRG